MLINSHVTADAACSSQHVPALRVVSTVSVGFDHIDLDHAFERGMTVTTTPGVLSDAVADVAIALMLMTARRLKTATDDLNRGVWSNGLLGRDLRGATLFLVGFGRIAREVADAALAAKMRVCVYDVFAGIPTMPAVEMVSDPRMTGWRAAEIVSLHVDLNPTTHHLIDDAALARMKPGAILVNTARGGVVDQAALTGALASGHLGGAGLDVLETEPPDPNDPLLALPNVVVLPHIASATVETRLAMLDLAIDNLAACLRGDACACASCCPARRVSRWCGPGSGGARPAPSPRGSRCSRGTRPAPGARAATRAAWSARPGCRRAPG